MFTKIVACIIGGMAIAATAWAGTYLVKIVFDGPVPVAANDIVIGPGDEICVQSYDQSGDPISERYLFTYGPFNSMRLRSNVHGSIACMSVSNFLVAGEGFKSNVIGPEGDVFDPRVRIKDTCGVCNHGRMTRKGK